MSLKTVLAKHPLDVNLTEFIQAAEEEGIAWALAGGPEEPCKVTLFPDGGNAGSFEIEDEQPHVAFQKALKRYKKEKK